MDLSYLPGFLAAYTILFLAAFSPGPAVALLIGIGFGQGRRAAMIAALGIASGSSVINILTLLGVGLLLSQAAWAMQVLRLIGAAYLLYLAYGAFRSAMAPGDVTIRDVRHQSSLRLWTTGFLMHLTNPKAIVFWLAIASVGATEGGGLGIAALFVLGAFLISFACHAAWALLLSADPVRAAYRRVRRSIEGALSVFFVFAAWRLATREP